MILSVRIEEVLGERLERLAQDTHRSSLTACQ